LSAGEEIRFQYGTHSSGLLFAEYGFVELPPTMETPRPVAADKDGSKPFHRVRAERYDWTGLPHGELDLGHHIRGHGDRKGVWEEFEPVLKAIGCWE